MFSKTVLFSVAAALVAVGFMSTVPRGEAQAPGPSSGTLLAKDLALSIGGAVGPDGALYVPEGKLGIVSRIDPVTGAKTTAAQGLPITTEDAGAWDVAFIGNTMYILVTRLAAPVPPGEPAGVYRLNQDGSLTLVADITAFNTANPLTGGDHLPAGNPFALEPISADAFLVSDANYNRLLRVGLDGSISILVAYGNIVPTGLQLDGNFAYVSYIGPHPHLPETGLVNRVNLTTGETTTVASGVPYLIDVTAGPGGQQFVLSFGEQPETLDGPPAVPFSGKILVMGPNGLRPVVTGLMIPTSLHISGDTAFVVTLAGEVWRIDGLTALAATPTPVPPATPTAVPPTATAVPPTATPTRVAPTPPSTGTGTAPGGTSMTLGILAALLLAAGGATVLAARRR